VLSEAPSLSASWFVESATSAPQSLALVDGSRLIDYAELERSSAALAQQLLDRRPAAGATPWLPILVDRSVESCIAVLAAIRSATPFAPIDPGLPPGQIAAMFRRVGDPTLAVVARGEFRELIPDGIEAIETGGHPEKSQEPLPVDRDRPAVVVFTSGSTGVPKAVVRPWRMFDPKADQLPDEGPLHSGSVMRKALLLPLSFSAGINHFTGLRGRSMHIADPSVMTGAALVRWLADEQIESLEVPPSLAATIVRLGAGRRVLPDLSILRLFGEQFDWRLVEELRRIGAPELHIHTTYSATECGNVTRFEIGPEVPIGRGSVPVGLLSPGLRVRIEPASDDGPLQQIVIADPAALGYLDDLAGGSARFETDERGTRWWWSGDLVEVDADGVIHHRGRVDESVKINGVLVEPAAAEQLLRSVPGVARAAVIAHPSTRGPSRLVAHVELDGGTEPDELRAPMADRLHRAAVPQVLMRHDRLPLNANGKIDRTALRNMSITPWVTDHRAPQTEDQRFMCTHLATMLELGQVGIDDDLFQLGLDSLGAIEFLQVLADVGIGELDPTALAEHRTVAAIAEVLAAGGAERSSDVVMLNQGGTAPVIIGVPGAGDMATRFWDLAAGLGPDRPIAIVEAHGLHVLGRVDRSVVGAATRVAAEARELCPEGILGLMGHSAGAAVAFEAAQQLHDSGRTVAVALLDPAFSEGPILSTASHRRPWWRRLPLRPGFLRNPPRSWDELRFRLYARWPGRPVNDPRRYRAFHLIGTHAASLYRLRAARFPVLWVSAADSDVGCAQSLEVEPGGWIRRVTVPGDHLSIFDPPFVEALVEQLDEFLNIVMNGSEGSGSTLEVDVIEVIDPR
jgi:acyl-coenzyme A synthetase/AMP-(fatty) acid ligase/aryl carrier-like protein